MGSKLGFGRDKDDKSVTAAKERIMRAEEVSRSVAVPNLNKANADRCPHTVGTPSRSSTYASKRGSPRSQGTRSKTGNRGCRRVSFLHCDVRLTTVTDACLHSLKRAQKKSEQSSDISKRYVQTSNVSVVWRSRKTDSKLQG